MQNIAKIKKFTGKSPRLHCFLYKAVDTKIHATHEILGLFNSWSTVIITYITENFKPFTSMNVITQNASLTHSQESKIWIFQLMEKSHINRTGHFHWFKADIYHITLSANMAASQMWLSGQVNQARPKPTFPRCPLVTKCWGAPAVY